MTEDQSTPEDAQRPQGEPRFSFTDKRKVDPVDGSVRATGSTPAPGPDTADAAAGTPEAGAAATAHDGSTDSLDAEAAALYEQARQDDAEPGDARVAELEQQVADLTEQLKREQAEYVNSRRRIEAAAEVAKEAAVGRVLSSLISVLDDVELGRQHGDIVEGTTVHTLTQKLEGALRAHGMERYGAVGDPFDPTLHEALMHEEAEVEQPEISVVMQPGYRMHDKVLRPARVGTRGPA